MVLLAAEAEAHIIHALGHAMSSEVSHMQVLNLAGRTLCSMYPWCWLSERTALLDLEAGMGFVRLPRNLAALEKVRGVGNAANNITLTGADSVHALRVYSSESRPWLGSVLRRTMPAPNLLRYSDAPSQTDAWSFTTGTGAVTPNVAINPFTGANTVSTVEDNDATATSALTQIIPAHLLKDATAYSFELVFAPYPITTPSPAKAGILISTESPGSNGLQTQIEIQWGATPWQDPPTATVVGTNSGGAAVGTPRPVGQGCWAFPVTAYLHQLDKNYGVLRVGVQPARAAFGDVSGTEVAATTGAIAFVRAQANEGKLVAAYEVVGPTLTIPSRLEPVLEVEPTPTDTSVGALSVLYRAGWADVTEDDQELPLPAEGWLDTLYIQIVRAYALGWEQQGTASLDRRLAEIEAGPIAHRAKTHDGLFQSSYGQMKNTAFDMANSGAVSEFRVSFDTSGPVPA